MDNLQEAIKRRPETSNATHTQLILVDTSCDGTATVTLNRPQKRNALSAALIADLNVALQVLERKDSLGGGFELALMVP
ncbi:uncharacterized protein KY384_002381 [Bacidia gigantensis]|uniref:uncharacterized protein n=1 Tax=Bacidia gigantensis TaxID=2732470 RepID=UPI001D0457C3|nr:uncharacterized protein KY384_002381 [Bacidia gigantensis]KAG8532504.1 hypothetical protein KY384_002381 [Bacidia gigantensis]